MEIYVLQLITLITMIPPAITADNSSIIYGLMIKPDISAGDLIAVGASIIIVSATMIINWLKNRKLVKAQTWYGKGHSLLHSGHREGAIECFDKALKANSSHADAWYWKGIALSILERYEESIECFNRANELDPENFKRIFSRKGSAFDGILGQCERYVKVGMCEEALSRLDKTPDLFSKYGSGGMSPRAWTTRATALKGLGRSEEADEAYRKASE